jgi:phosphoglycerate dehydrogenase-like enzyme
MYRRRVSKGIAIAPDERAGFVREALQAAGAGEASLEDADALIWVGGGADELAAVLGRASRVRWVQLPSAGIEQYLPLMTDGRTWTAAKGVYADQCAELALGLAVAGFRHLDHGARHKSWHQSDGQSLFGARVAIVGGGGIAQSMLRLLAPFTTQTTVIRRQSEPTPGAARTLTPEHLMEALADADLVVLAAPLTPATEGMVAEPQLRVMKPDAWLINVARGRLVRTDDLVRALREHWIGGAGLDVTEPEPLPDGHPLWNLDNCLITSHTANPPNLEQEVLAKRITENVRRYLRGETLLGVVDPAAGY